MVPAPGAAAVATGQTQMHGSMDMRLGRPPAQAHDEGNGGTTGKPDARRGKRVIDGGLPAVPTALVTQGQNMAAIELPADVLRTRLASYSPPKSWTG